MSFSRGETELIDILNRIDSTLDSVEESSFLESLVEGVENSYRRFVLVDIRGYAFAIELSDIDKIEEIENVTFLPNLPRWILGVVNVKGEVVSAVDILSFFDVDKDVGRINKLVVVKNKNVKVGVGVNMIIGTVSILDGDEETKLATVVDSDLAKQFLYKKSIDGKEYNFIRTKELIEKGMGKLDV